MGLFGGPLKDLRAHRALGDRLRRTGKLDEAAAAYRALMRELAAEGLKLRAAAACRLVLEVSPGDIEARETLKALTGAAAADDITLEVQPTDVLVEHPSAPPPLPEDDDLRRLIARSARLCAGVPAEVAEAVALAFAPAVLPAGSPLMRGGRDSPGLYAIEGGEVDVVGSDAPGGVRPGVVGCATLLGEMSALPDNRASGDVLARTPVTALFLAADALGALSLRHPPLRARLDKLSICRRALDARLRPDFPTPL